jgi:hypothetical protein
LDQNLAGEFTCGKEKLSNLKPDEIVEICSKFLHLEIKIVYRGGTFMLTVLAVIARLTLGKTKNKVILSWFIGTSCIGRQHNRSDKMHL